MSDLSPSLELNSLSSRRALIVGATGGIGRALAHALARSGVDLTLSGRDPERLNALQSELVTLGASVRTQIADISRAPQVQKLVAFAAENPGNPENAGLDIVVNAAGVGAIRSIESFTPEEITAVLAANLYGAMLLSQAAVAAMTPKKSGHLLHVVGILGKAPMPNASVYCASKYGLSGFLQALRAEVSRKHNIKITALYLGGVDTPFYDNPAIEMRVQRDKMLSAGDAANAIVYALSQPSHLVLGELTLQPDSHQL